MLVLFSIGDIVCVELYALSCVQPPELPFAERLRHLDGLTLNMLAAAADSLFRAGGSSTVWRSAQ